LGSDFKCKGIIKTLIKIVVYPLAVLLALLITLTALLRDPRIQQIAARIAAEYFSREWKTEVRISGFSFGLSKGLDIEGLMVKDQKGSVLLSAEVLSVSLDLKQLATRNIHVKKVIIENGEFQLITHKGDSTLNLQFILDYFSSKDSIIKPVDTTAGPPWSISGASIQLTDFRFHFQDENSEPVPVGMDYSNIDAAHIYLKLTNFSIQGDTINANIPMLMAQERSGFNLYSFSGEFSVSSHFIKARNLKILTDNSDLSLDFSFNYNGYAAFNDFLDKVTIDADISPSVFDLQDIGYFAAEVMPMKDRMNIEGRINGTVSKFRAKDFKVSYGNNTSFDGDILSIGLPDVYATYVDMDIRSLKTDFSDVKSFRLPGDSGFIPVPDIIKYTGKVEIKGRYTGFWDDFKANATVTTEIGNVVANLSLKKTKPKGLFTYEGDIAATAVNLGLIAGNQDLLGHVSFRGAITGEGFDPDNSNIRLNVQVDSIDVNHYRYRHISVDGELADKVFNGMLSARDPNLNMDFRGKLDFQDSIPKFDFKLKIEKSDLFALHLFTRDSTEHFSGEIYADFTGDNLDNMKGRLSLSHVVFREGLNVADMDSLLLYAGIDRIGNKTFRLQSDFIDADISGNFQFTNLVSSMEAFIRNYLANFRMKDSLKVDFGANGQLMKYIIEFKETDELTAIFLPFLKIGPGTTLSGYYDEDQQVFSMQGDSPEIILGGLEIEDWYLDAESTLQNLSVRTGSKKFYLIKPKGGDTLDIRIDSLNIRSDLNHDSIRYAVDWRGRYGASNFNGFVTFADDGSIGLKFNDFNVAIKKNIWSISKENYITFDTSSIHVSKLEFLSGSQGLGLDGRISGSSHDTLNVLFNKLDISELDYFLQSNSIDIDGVLSGKVKLANLSKGVSFISDLTLERFKFNKELLGDATILVKYNQSERRFDVNSQIIYSGNIGKNIPLSVSGSYYLAKDNPHFDFDIVMKNLNLVMVEPFVSSFMSKLTGLASGEAKLTGTLDAPVITGQIKLMRTEFKIGYLNVPYSFAADVGITKNQFLFKDIILYDSLGNKATLNGDISHDHFKDIKLNLNVEMKDFLAFYNTADQNTIFYGKARASGSVRVYGPIDNIGIDVKAVTGSNTHVIIPINLTAGVGDMDYIVFEEADTAKRRQAGISIHPAAISGITLNLNLRVTPDASVEVFFPDQLGNLAATGNGNLTMTMTPTTPFLINGSYVITKGSFLVQVKNLLRLPFSMSPGSEINWTGDPTNADLRLSAGYKTKVPLAGLTTDPEVASVRVPVECMLYLNGKLMNPKISFGLNMSTAEESAKNIVYNSIDTTNQTEMAEQVMYILVLNMFKPIKGGSMGTVDVGGTSLSILTNQLNSWLSQISKNVNVGINYNPGTSNTGTEFDVGISTQFLDDRLLVDGTFGMSTYKNTTVQEASTIVGDINIQYVLTKNRRLRVRAFNQTNSIDILNNNAPYTQGVGIAYQREFSNIKELFTRKKKTQTKTPPTK
jgi:hypothetical protein